MSAKLSKWKYLLPELSYRDRGLVINNLSVSIKFTFSNLADAFIHRDLKIRTMEAIIINKRANLCYNKSYIINKKKTDIIKKRIEQASVRGIFLFC